MFTEGVVTFIAGAALGARLRVKVKAATATDPVEVELAGAGEQHIGVTEAPAASGQPVAVRMRHHNGTLECVAAGAFARGAAIYGAAAGKVDDAVSGNQLGIALSAAGADGDHVIIANVG